MIRKLISGAIACMALFTASAPAMAQYDRRVVIVNNTDYDIIQFFGSNAARRSWEEDVLGDNIIPSHSRRVINFNDGSGYCKFDFKAVFEDNDKVFKYGINVCAESSWTINP